MIFGHNTPAEHPYPGCSFVARVAFEYGPRAFRAGEDFPLATCDGSFDKARDLWVAGRLLVKPKAQPATPLERKRKAG